MKQANTNSKKIVPNRKRKAKKKLVKQTKQGNKRKDTSYSIKMGKSPSNKKKAVPSKKAVSKKKKTARSVKKRKKQRHQFYKEIGVSFFLMIVFLFTLQLLFFNVPKVNGYGMTQTLDDGDRLFVSKHSTIKRFDMVYLKHPDTKQVMVRRVIGLPNEEVSYKDDQLMINRKPVVERFLKNEIIEAAKENRLLTEDFTLASLTDTTTLPKDSYFVLGDNRHYAADSREFGWIEKKDILGVVKARILPFHHMTQF